VCQITCNTSTSSVCTATPAASPCSVGNGTAPMDAAKCEQFCKDSWEVRGAENEDVCRFWRFETIDSVATCTFLNSTQCASFETCDGADCECGDAGCYVEGQETPEPPVKSCQGGIEYHFDADWIHWVCVNDEVPDLSSPYRNESAMPPNTKCYTTHKCSDWASEAGKQLSVRCDGLTGNWTQNSGNLTDPGGPYADVLGTQPAPIKEHQCLGENKTILTVNIDAMQDGAQLSCETPPDVDGPQATTYTITPPNKCVLLCDYHLALTFEGRLSGEGELKFYVANAEPEQEINNENVQQKIKCWPESN